MSEFGDKLKKALDATNNVNTYIWKGPKVNGVQKEYKLIDCDQETLQKHYDHCVQMLYNEDDKNPGRLVLLDIVNQQIQSCRAELLIRWLRAAKQFSNTRCFEVIRTLIANNKDTLNEETIKTCPISKIMGGIDDLDLREVPVELVRRACLDTLGTMNTNHLTLNFILRMGLWFTNKEMQTPWPDGLYKKDPDTGKAMNRLELVKKELQLNPNISLKVDPTGLSYSEFRSMCRLRKDKYSNLTSDQLRLLSSKVLYRFQNQCETQAEQWINKIKEIKEVAAHKGFNLVEATKDGKPI